MGKEGKRKGWKDYIKRRLGGRGRGEKQQHKQSFKASGNGNISNMAGAHLERRSQEINVSSHVFLQQVFM